MLAALIAVPLGGALLTVLVGSNRHRPLLLPVVALLHLALTVALLVNPPPPSPEGWFQLDPLGRIVLASTSLLFLGCAAYAAGYLTYRQERSNRNLCLGLLVCLAAMSLATFSHHLGLLWVAVEATTLAMAPLIYFNRNARSIEATWKYLLICSVGIALAMLGLLFLAYATIVAGQNATLLLAPLLATARQLDPGWLHGAVIFLLVGFGTKVGLAPLHTWKPDAYGEAPGLVGALLAGGLVNCALLAILRVYQVCLAAGGEAAFLQRALLGLGLLSMAVAAVFLLRQADFKRMLAYSSVEHVGILAVALGLGKGALFGALLHLINNGLTKGVLFLSSGNLHRAYGSKSSAAVSGALRRVPWSAGLFLAGFFAISGSPPFATFLSEFTIVSSAFLQGRYLVGTLFLFFLVVVFLGMALTILPMVWGKLPRHMANTPYRDRFLTVAPPLLLLGVVLLLGTWLPAPLLALLQDGAALLEARP